jgi:hypothetical protein
MTFEQRTRLNKLNSLRAQGLLTDAAFKEAKDEVLSREVKGVRRFADVIVLFLAIAMVLGCLLAVYIVYQRYQGSPQATRPSQFSHLLGNHTRITQRSIRFPGAELSTLYG